MKKLVDSFATKTHNERAFKVGLPERKLVEISAAVVAFFSRLYGSDYIDRRQVFRCRQSRTVPTN